MLTPYGHLTYCTNIHKGETWREHFAALKEHFPSIKHRFSPSQPMGIGLRLSNEASIDLIKEENLADFKQWLIREDAYVFTMNGFPYGGFHSSRVKEKVHEPDWTKQARADYTIRLFQILSSLLPADMDGGVSTSPLGYRLAFKDEKQLNSARKTGTDNIIRVLEKLIEIHKDSGKLLHLDIEPEPDGILESGTEFMDWYEQDLLPAAIPVISTELDVSRQEAENLIKDHIRLCYDVCHFGVGFEPHQKIIEELMSRGIKIGKVQLSAALRAPMNSPSADTENIKESFEKYDESVYLHQVVAKTTDGNLMRYPDLPDALKDTGTHDFTEWRSHFHVPVFVEKFGLLSSTQPEIVEVLELQKRLHFTNHLEVETYTWEVLPASLKLPIRESIVRELQWVKNILDD